MGKIVTVKGDGGFNKNLPSNDSGAGFVFGGGAQAPTGLAFGETSDPLTGIEQVEALGIDETYDTNNDVLIWQHLKRHWHRSPNAKTWIMVAPAGTPLADMADNANPYLSKLILDSEGEAKTVGLVMNPQAAYTSVVTEGIDQDVLNAIPKAQATIDAHAVQYRNILVVIEGRELTGTAGAMDDLRENESGGVVVTVLQDPVIAAKGGLFQKYADVGTTVGIISRSAVHENGGWTEKYNLQDKSEGYYLTVNMSDGQPAKNREAEYQALTDKGITFGRTYPQQSGVYFEDSPTCALLDSDFAYWTETRVMNKAIIQVYNKLFPKINAPLKIDAETGHLDLEVVKSFEALGQEPLDHMENIGELSGGECYIDPAQDLKTQGKLIVKISLVNIDTGRYLEVQIGFTKKLG